MKQTLEYECPLCKAQLDLKELRAIAAKGIQQDEEEVKDEEFKSEEVERDDLCRNVGDNDNKSDKTFTLTKDITYRAT